MKLGGNTVLITGGSSGIGRGLACALYDAGSTVIITGRRKQALDAVVAAHPGMIARHLDMDDASQIANFAAQLSVEYPELNVVINNAGIMVPEDKIELAIAESMITINLLGPIRLTSALLPHLLAQPRAALINVSSALAFVPWVPFPTYCATKAALHSWSIALRGQLRGTNTEVIEVIPPGVQTDLLPGQAENPQAMPLGSFIDETIAQLGREPTPTEVCGERADFMRKVVDAKTFKEVLGTLNQWTDA